MTIATFPASSRERSSTRCSMFVRRVASRWTMAANSARSAAAPAPSSPETAARISAKLLMDVRGVRSSWLMDERKSSFRLSSTCNSLYAFWSSRVRSETLRSSSRLNAASFA